MAIIAARSTVFTELTFDELRLLREVTKRTIMRHYHRDHVTDREADRIIESRLPATREHFIKLAVENRWR